MGHDCLHHSALSMLFFSFCSSTFWFILARYSSENALIVLFRLSSDTSVTFSKHVSTFYVFQSGPILFQIFLVFFILWNFSLICSEAQDLVTYSFQFHSCEISIESHSSFVQCHRSLCKVLFYSSDIAVTFVFCTLICTHYCTLCRPQNFYGLQIPIIRMQFYSLGIAFVNDIIRIYS